MAHTECMLTEVFPPGDFIQEELDARGWLQTDFVEILGVDKKTVSEIVAGKRSITPEMAMLIGEAFGTGPAVWLNLDNEYQLFKTKIDASRSASVSRKGKLYAQYPVRDMVKRGWISQTGDIDALEVELDRFFSPEDLRFAARRNMDASKESLQRAWLYRAYHLAKKVSASPYSEIRLQQAMGELKTFLAEPRDVAKIPHVLASAGVRFLLVEALPGSHIDGVCFSLDRQRPVVALSARFDRIDNFWFTLIHELHHVKHKHAQDQALLDLDIMERTKGLSMEERIADKEASEFLVPHDKFEKFVRKSKPWFGSAGIREFSNTVGVHPGIVVGRLQHREVIDQNQHRSALPKVRHLLLPTAPHDGWGNVA